MPKQEAPPPPPPKEAPPPPPKVKLATFFSKGSFSSSAAKATGAQMTSYAKKEAHVTFKVQNVAGGTASLELKGRFKVTITETGGTIQVGGGKALKAGAPAGKSTAVSVKFLDGKLRVKVGGKNHGPYSVSASGFPAWKFQLKPGVKITNLVARAIPDPED